MTEARRNFARIGAGEARRVAFVRDPLPEEYPLN
ncbi:hypothetical protein [Streptomyces sp. NPDC049040]